jgi:tetratricopeptide (TPR) repeat protein
MRAYGAALQRHREFAAAREIWQWLRHVHPEDATAFLGLADAYDGLGDHTALVQILLELVARFPRHAAYRSRLAETYVRLGQTAEAKAV